MTITFKSEQCNDVADVWKTGYTCPPGKQAIVLSDISSGGANTIYKSTDGAETWTPVYTASFPLYKFIQLTAGIFVYGTSTTDTEVDSMFVTASTL